MQILNNHQETKSMEKIPKNRSMHQTPIKLTTTRSKKIQKSSEKNSNEKTISMKSKIKKSKLPLFLTLGQWTDEEDLKLLELVHQYGPYKWSQIANFLPHR